MLASEFLPPVDDSSVARSFQIAVPSGLSGLTSLYVRGRAFGSDASPLVGPFVVTIHGSSVGGGSGGGGSGGGGGGTVGPTVKSVVIASAKGKPKTINITFIGTVDASVITDLSLFTLISAGRDRRFGTKDDKVLKLSKASYTASTHILKLQPKQPLSIVYPLELVVTGLLSTGTSTYFLGPKAKH